MSYVFAEPRENKVVTSWAWTVIQQQVEAVKPYTESVVKGDGVLGSVTGASDRTKAVS